MPFLLMMISVMLIGLMPCAAMAKPVSIFGVAPVPDNELAKQRGGFIAPGGLVIDFSLTSQTIINGDVLRDLKLSSDQLQTVQNLRQVIQIGDNNKFEDPSNLNNPSLTTIIQNSLDGTVIQNVNVIDIMVQNYTEYRNNIPLGNMLTQLDSLR